MSRRIPLILALLLSPVALSTAAKNRPPNVDFILTVNQGAWTLGCYGNPDNRTPNFEAMADLLITVATRQTATLELP